MRAQNTAARRLLALLAVTALLTAPMGAQNSQSQPQQQTPQVDPRQAPAPPPTPLPRGKGTIRSTVDLVEIDVQVTDRNGKPLKGLNQEQFTVTEDGKAQKVSTFDYNDIEKLETASATEEAPIMVPIGSVASSQPIKAMVHDHRMIVLFFDLTSLQPDDLLRSTRAAEKYLREQMTPADLVGIFAFGNTLKVIANFTNNRELLQQSVEALIPGHEAALAQLAEAATAANGEAAVTEDTGAAFTADDTEFNVFNTDRKLAAMEAVCEVLEGIPGKKSVIQFTSGVTQTGEENRSQLIAAPTPRIAPTFPSTRWTRAACYLQHREAMPAWAHRAARLCFPVRPSSRKASRGRIRAKRWRRSRATPAGVRFSTSVTSPKSSKTCRTTTPVTTSLGITARTRRGMGAGGAST